MIMKTGRRTDSDTLRRDIRDRDISRFNRKRPSMLSEFHGKHHSYRDSDRDGPDVSHFRSYNRYSYDGSGVPSDHSNRSTFNPSTVSGGLYNKIKPDPRGKRMYSPLASQFNYRTPSLNYHHFRNDNSEGSFEEDLPMKRPRLYVDVNRRAPANLDPPSSADSISSSTHMSGGQGTPNNVGSPAVSPPHSSLKGGSGLSAYLEDIDSEDDDPLLREDDSTAKSTPSLRPTTVSSNEDFTREEPHRPVVRSPLKDKKKTEDCSAKVVVKPSKEELLQMMEKVDRDISTLESQIVNLQKKQAELEEGAKTMPSSFVPPSTPSPKTPSPDITSEMDQGDQSREETPPTSPTPFSDGQPSPKRTLAETIYAENKAKARAAQCLLQSVNFHPLPLHGIVPLYLQPSEAPCYHDNITSHGQFRPRLVEYLKRRKLSRHQRELSLCGEYDSQMADWERRVERIETSSKKKVRDMKNRELFERTFPELKARREQLERFSRVDQRGFGVVRSDAELNELMYELCNKEEAPARYRKTHAVIPPMLVDERSKFVSSNGHIDDVMAVHRDLKFCNIWTDEEKSTFREKFTLYPKNFDMISTFLPNKSPGDCVKYYYLSKKSENFKQLVRKANLKRKKALIKPPELSLSTSSLNVMSLSAPSLSIMGREKPKAAVQMVDQPPMEEEEKIKSEFGDWTDENISNLKEGLSKYGRAWGKVYREVGGSKTATQCKMFYDDYCTDERLGLQESLKEHSIMKNAEKQQRKSQTRKSLPAGDAKKKALSQQTNAPSPMRVEPNDGDSENTESASESDTNAEESESESTITDSGPDDVMSEAMKVTPQPKQTRARGGGSVGKKSNLPSLTSPPPSGKTSEDVVDLFLTAAEALKNNISPEVALHDHSYALPPSQLVNNMDLQGTSGLSLIAAAAAVVSPNLSRNAGSGKHPVMSPVRAPRGRPPNKYRGGGSNSTSKLAPTLLSPAGSSANVLLTDIKTAAFRNRTRSAPTDRPKSSTLHIPRSGSTLARMSLNNSTGRGGSKGTSVMPPVAYSKQKSERSSSPSLKSMIALRPQQATGNTSAFEALVNVAVAAPPAELPKLSTTSVHGTTGSIFTGKNSKRTSVGSRSSHSTPSPVSALSSKGTLSRSNSNDCNNSSPLNNGSSSGATATAYIDVSQAINILASLAQQTPGSSVGTSHAISVFQAQPLFAQTQALSASNLLESIVSQSNSKQSTSSTSTSSNGTSTASSISVTSNPASVSATVDTLLSHLTSGVNRSNSPTVRNTSSPKPVGRPRKIPRMESSSRSSSTTQSVSKSSSGSPCSSTGSNPQTSDDLSNLKLLSSLVAAVAATQSAPSMTTTQTLIDVSSHTSTPVPSTQTGGTLSAKNSRSSYDRSSEIPNAAHQKLYSNNCTPSPVSCQHSTSLLNSVSSSTISSAHSETPSPDELPRSVVRPNPSAYPPNSSQRSLHVDSLNSYTHANSTANFHEASLSGNATSTPLLNSFPPSCIAATTGDMTASLASIIPSYNPSVGQQSTLLLYTRSRSFPLSASSEPCLDEEDHLESATRGISELSKLLGTDGNGGCMETESPGISKKTHETQISNCDNSSDFISTPSTVNSTNGPPMSSLARAILNDYSTSSGSDNNSSPPLKRNLSNLLESRGTVHHTANSVGDSPGNHGDGLNNDTPLNVDTQSR